MSPWKVGAGVAAGLGIGVIFFGGLWWTVRNASSLRSPALAYLLSAIIRFGSALVGFYWMYRLGPSALVAAGAAFLACRTAALRIARGKGGVTHAP